jgi:UDP-N-acetylglucosamine--N-acetylmuramyl-(pentapeptide) pyrophosphoryl-undecaprenol N-acetylglucosamine transferase
MTAQTFGVRVLAVAGQGGHLAELHQLLPRMLPPGTMADWATIDTPHSRSLLSEAHVAFMSPVAPRDVPALLSTMPSAAGLLRRRRYGAVIASGNVALAFLPLAHVLGLSVHYIESATRTAGPSLSGRLLGVVPGAHRYTQHPGWADASWLYRGSVFDNYQAEERHAEPQVGRVVVALGMNPYPFRRLLERLVQILPPSAEVLWQTGVTTTAGLPIRPNPVIPARDLDHAMADADVIVAHAGAGSALGALQAGRIPVLVPRLRAHGEQVDDHQPLLADDLARRGLAVVTSVDDLTSETLRRASTLRARRREHPPPFDLSLS